MSKLATQLTQMLTLLHALLRAEGAGPEQRHSCVVLPSRNSTVSAGQIRISRGLCPLPSPNTRAGGSRLTSYREN